jgi:crotonobetainyl-CoA:carnitine CoA-transferase CaiB-like acyl-CoA transferase
MDGEYVHIAALADRVFQRLAEAMGRPELAADPKFKTQSARNANESEIEGIVQEWAGGKNAGDIQQILDKADVPATKIFKMKDIFSDPHFKERNMLVDVEDDDIGSVTLVGVVPKLSRTPGKIKWAGRKVGQDTENVLAKYLALTPTELEALEEKGVVYMNREGKQPVKGCYQERKQDGKI